MAHPLSPAPLSPRYRDGALRPGQIGGGGIVPGADILAIRQAEALRAANQAARGDRQVLRPVVYGGSSLHTLTAYLIDSANPDTETKLDASYPDGLAFGKDYDTDRKREIIFKMNPLPARLYAYYLALRATIEVVNRGPEAADLTGALHMRRLDDADDKWASLPVTWGNRESWWTTEETLAAPLYFNQFFVYHEVGGGYTDYDVYYPYPTSIVPGGKYTYSEELTYAFSQDTLAVSEEKQYWNNVTFDHDIDPYGAQSLPEIGWALKWSFSNRYHVPGEDGFGNPIQIYDQHMDINCKFYGYDFYVSGEPYA